MSFSNDFPPSFAPHGPVAQCDEGHWRPNGRAHWPWGNGWRRKLMLGSPIFFGLTLDEWIFPGNPELLQKRVSKTNSRWRAEPRFSDTSVQVWGLIAQRCCTIMSLNEAALYTYPNRLQIVLGMLWVNPPPPSLKINVLLKWAHAQGFHPHHTFQGPKWNL